MTYLLLITKIKIFRIFLQLAKTDIKKIEYTKIFIPPEFHMFTNLDQDQ